MVDGREARDRRGGFAREPIDIARGMAPRHLAEPAV